MNAGNFTITKRFVDIPFAHRQPNHEGHCRLIHGHNWTFEITFACNQLDANGFVVDFGKLHGLKATLDLYFDHALVLNHGDYLDFDNAAAMHDAFAGLARITHVPNCGAEGLAKFVCEMAQTCVLAPDVDRDEQNSARGLRVVRVTVLEDSKNSATYVP